MVANKTMSLGKPKSATTVVDGIIFDLNRAVPAIGAVIMGPEAGARVVLTMPTFDGCDPLPAKRFSQMAKNSPQFWLCLAISLDYGPIRRTWGEVAGWSTPSIDLPTFKEQFGVFAPRIGLFVPALFIIDASNHLLYSDVPPVLDGKVDFDAASKVLLN